METGQTSRAMPRDDDQVEQVGVLGGADAVAEPAARAGPRRRPAPSPGRAARRRAAPAAGRPARRSGRPARSPRCEPRRSSLESPKPTTPRPAYCAASRARVRASSGCRVRLAAITTAIPMPTSREASRDRVEDQVGERGDPAELRGVPARVDLDLQPAATVALVVLGGLADQPAYVVLGAQHRPGDVVEPLEPEPALLVGRRERRRPVLDQRVGQVVPVALGELEQRGVPHGAGEVEVQVGLGKLCELAQAWLSGFARVMVAVARAHGRGQPATFSAAASSTQVATASIAAVTSASSGKVGARRMLRSRGSSPFGNDEPAGVSAMPASLASCDDPRGGAVEHVEADEVAAGRLGPRRRSPRPPSRSVRTRSTSANFGAMISRCRDHVVAHALGRAEELRVPQLVELVRADRALAEVADVPLHGLDRARRGRPRRRRRR